MSESASLPKIHRSTLERCGNPKGFEQWLIEGHRAEIIEDVVTDGAGKKN